MGTLFKALLQSIRPIRFNFNVDNQISLFICPVLDSAFRHGQAHAFLWTTKFESGQINPKFDLPIGN